MENFIFQYQIPNDCLNICDDLISYFHNKTTNKREGIAGDNVNNQFKSSTDCSIYNTQKEIEPYFSHLEKAFNLYCNKYPFYPKNSHPYNGTNIQYYKKGQGFKQWHNERTNGKLNFVGRNLVFMTYLNDVPNGGTEWMYQNYKSEAKKGLTVLWPSDFTHTHRGIISNEYEKYIITGWFVFKN